MRCNKFFLFSVSFFLFYELVSTFQYYMQVYFKIPTYFPTILLMFAVLTNLTRSRVFVPAVVCCFLSWIFFMIAYVAGYVDHPTFLSIPMLMNQMCRSAVCLMVFFLITSRRDYCSCKFILYISAIAIFSQCILCFFALMKNADIARNIVSAERIEGEYFKAAVIFEAKRDGVASYAFIHSLPLLVPGLMAIVKSPLVVRWKKRLLMLFMGGILLFLVKTQYTTPILLFIMLFVLSLFWSRDKLANLIFIVLVLVLCGGLYVWGKPIFEVLLKFLGSIITEGAIAQKIDDALMGLSSVHHDTLAEGRSMRYAMSWTQFFEAPLFGCKDVYKLGGHSYFPDILGFFGLFWSLPFFGFMFCACRSIMKTVHKTYSHFVLFSFIGYVCHCCLKNAGANEFYDIIFLIVPCILWLQSCHNPTRSYIRYI